MVFSKSNDSCTDMMSRWISPRIAFVIVSAMLGQLGDGLNIFQGIYLVGIGWNEGAVGVALSLMGLTSLLVQPFAGDWVDKATIDRRVFLVIASIATAISASTILLVRVGNTDHMLIYVSKVLEGIASSFIAPCLAALTLASFGPNHFDTVMASNMLWGHVGSVTAAVLAGIIAYVIYPDVKFCFLVVGASALMAIVFVYFLPQGDPLMGRGFQGKVAMDLDGNAETVMPALSEETESLTSTTASDQEEAADAPPEAASYLKVFLDPMTCIVCMTGFFFHFANANVLLVLGEMMGGGGDGTMTRTAIPYTAGNIITAQLTMAAATWIADRLTKMGYGRKPLFMAGIVALPIRCALIILLKDAGQGYLMSTQILDGVAGGLMGLIQPYLIADITFGTGRFNVVMGLSTSCWGMGATLSNYLGQLVVQHYGHIASLTGSLIISFAPIILFSRMPETFGCRGNKQGDTKAKKSETGYKTFDVESIAAV